MTTQDTVPLEIRDYARADYRHVEEIRTDVVQMIRFFYNTDPDDDDGKEVAEEIVIEGLRLVEHLLGNYPPKRYAVGAAMRICRRLKKWFPDSLAVR